MAGRIDVVAYLKLFRFPLVFTAIADSAAGYLCVRGPEIEVWILALLAGASAGLYLFGMGLNDIADIDRDRQLAPTRVLPSGRLSLGMARSAVLTMLSLSFLCVMWLGLTGYGPQILFPWMAAVLCIVAYDLGWVKVPPTMGLVRASNMALGISIATRIRYAETPNQPYMFIPLCLPVLVYVTGLTFVSTLEDRQDNRVRLWTGAGIMVLGAFLAASVGAPRLWPDSNDAFVHATYGVFKPGLSLGALGFATLLSAWVLRRAIQAKDRKGIMLMVRDGIGGIILLESAVVVSSTGAFLEGLALALLVIPAAVSVAIFKKLA